MKYITLYILYLRLKYFLLAINEPSLFCLHAAGPAYLLCVHCAYIRTKAKCPIMHAYTCANNLLCISVCSA